MRSEDKVVESDIERILLKLISDFKNDWLLPIELLELAVKNNLEIKYNILSYLERLKNNKEHQVLIENGLKLIDVEVN